MQHIYKGRFVDDTTFVDEFGNEYTLQVSNFGGDDNDDDSDGSDNKQDNKDNQESSNNNSQSNSNNNNNEQGEGDDNNSSQDNKDDEDLIEPEVGALFDDVMTGKQYRWNGNEFEEV